MSFTGYVALEFARAFQSTEQTINIRGAQADRDAGVRHDGLTTAGLRKPSENATYRRIYSRITSSGPCRRFSTMPIPAGSGLRSVFFFLDIGFTVSTEPRILAQGRIATRPGAIAYPARTEWVAVGTA